MVEGTATPLKPLFLLADSQLLFWKPPTGEPFLNSVRQHLSQPHPKAAYLGASNGDLPEYFALFVAAMEGIGITDCRHIRAEFPAEDAAFLAQADLILLAGGDAELSMKTLKNTTAAACVLHRYNEGAVLIGVSAGAMQLGRYVIIERETASSELLDGFALLPYVIGVHEDATDWASLSGVVQLLEGAVTGIGIPAGNGFIFHPDATVEPARQWIYEFMQAGTGPEVVRKLLLPRGGETKGDD